MAAIPIDNSFIDDLFYRNLVDRPVFGTTVIIGTPYDTSGTWTNYYVNSATSSDSWHVYEDEELSIKAIRLMALAYFKSYLPTVLILPFRVKLILKVVSIFKFFNFLSVSQRLKQKRKLFVQKLREL